MISNKSIKIPFHKPSIGEEEIGEVIETLRSGWLTTGARVKRFEVEFAAYAGFRHAVAVNSATAALHLALEALGLRRGEAVIVPSLTFAATAEVVRYFDAIPLMVDCDPLTFNMDAKAARRIAIKAKNEGLKLRSIIPVHYGGQVGDVEQYRTIADEFGLSVVEDSAHCCPAYFRRNESAEWQKVGAGSDICCFSFYANKCITTGEGGMACTNDDRLAERMRIMSLHGISRDAWKRFSEEGTWYYEIVAPGFKYNLTDIAAAIGIHQLRKADKFRLEREKIALLYNSLLSGVPEVRCPHSSSDRVHSWHLYPVLVNLNQISLTRAEVIVELKARGVGHSVHWIPLHMHPYYKETYGFRGGDFPVAEDIGSREISLPIYPGLTDQEVQYVAKCLAEICKVARI